MPNLDMRTIFVCYFLVTAICVTIVTVQWRQYESRYSGLGLWVAGYFLQLLGLALIALRNIVPDLLSVTAGNCAIVGGLMLVLMGLRAFFESKSFSLLDWACFAAFVAAMTWFTAGRPDLRVRSILFSLAMIFVSSRGAWQLRRLRKGIRSIAAGTAMVMTCYGVISAARIALDASLPAGGDFIADPSVDSAVILAYQTLFVALTFAMISMIGRRVFFDQERLYVQKTLAEAALEASEERFSKAFQASPDAITISRLRDRRFIEVNEGFSRISGYTRNEALGDPPIDVWMSGETRDDLAAELERRSSVRDRVVFFRVKSGRAIRTSYSGELIELNGEKHIVSIVRDLSEKDRTDMILRVRLDLREYSVGHTTEELMVKALDEIEDMTDSRIGFYHFVDEDRGTISLQAWSTRTTREFCKASGKGMHYPVESAGVWADGLRARRPIIHNDYLSLPNKKGMPDGHALVKRELVAPTFRGGKIVSILGVGNKESDYTADDVALVSYIADLVWTIVEQKRAGERILELNHRLEELAMTDELTGLPNRRAFFAIAEREIQKARRYSSPLSFLMIDVDHFKDVNDTYGHDSGDAALASVARTLRKHVRDVDVAARLGGEEFGVLMPSTRLSDALLSAERLRAAVSKSACEAGGNELRVTVSIGVSARTEEAASLDSIMKSADKALYRAKEAGRDRVVVASDRIESS
jgi:diguanylate cyclase (GGDEF)-like protein/PAS domain S-box-containing protein